jgi:hypothetical protein
MQKIHRQGLKFALYAFFVFFFWSVVAHLISV